MGEATVIILHPPPDGDGPLTALLHEARDRLVEHQVVIFRAAGAGEVSVDRRPRTASFGVRLDELAATVRGGLVLLGAGSVPRLRVGDARRLLEVARAGGPTALTNDRYSSDVLAVGDAQLLLGLAGEHADNGLPRRLADARRHHRGAAGPRPPGHGPRYAARPGAPGAGRGRPALAARARCRLGRGRPAPARAPRAGAGSARGAARGRPQLGTNPGLARAPDRLPDPLPGRGARAADGAARAAAGPHDARTAAR